jgi:putative nucleotidyltransferase with HDIG domain
MHPQSARPASSSRALRVYLQVVVAAGVVVLAQAAFTAAHMPRPIGWLAVTVLTIVAGCFRVHFKSVSANIAIDDTFFISTALLFGPAAGTVTIALSCLLFSVLRKQRRSQVAFNTAALSLSLDVASRVFFAMAGVAPIAVGGAPITPLVVPLIALTLVYFVMNTLLTAIALGLDTRQSPAEVWKKNFRWLWIGYLGSASLAFCLILLLQQHSVAAAAMILPLFAVFYLTLRATFGRLDDARRHLGDMDRLYLSTVETLAMAIDAKDDVTHSHVRRVQAYAVGLARALNVADEPTLKAIEAAALLHDTGKLAVPEHILNKPGKLTVAEFDRMKLHVDVGADILSLVEFPYPVVPIVRAHHENWDGTGYPRGLSGEEIPIGARILSVVDCFDALTSDRPYRRRMTNAAAIEILLERRGRMYDPRAVDTFIEVYRDINVAGADMTEHREVLQRISQSHLEPAPSPERHEPADTAAAPTSLLAFVSLSRVASGDASVADVLALGSRLIGDVVPGATGAWYLPEAVGDHVVAVEAFGPAAHAVRGAAVVVGDRLTGWVAANRQPIVNSPANLDLGPRIETVQPPLRMCMSVPLLKGDALVAVLSLYSPETDAFDEATGRLIQMVAPHLAAAIHAAVAGAASAAEPKPASEKSAGGPLRLVATR